MRSYIGLAREPKKVVALFSRGHQLGLFPQPDGMQAETLFKRYGLFETTPRQHSAPFH
jgi:hypothetical protein